MNKPMMTQGELLLFFEKAGMISADDASAMKKIMMQNNDNTSTKKATLRSDGRWMAYANLDKRRKAVYGKTELDAVTKALAKEKQFSKQQEMETFSFEACFKRWRNFKLFDPNHSVESLTVARYEQVYQKYYAGKPIATTHVADIDTLFVSNFLNGCIKDADTMTYKEYHKIRQIVKDVLGYTSDYDDISLPTIDWEKVKRKLPTNRLFTPRKKEVAVSNETRDTLFREALTHNLCESRTSQVLCLLLNFSLGLRISELACVKWSDIDEYKRVICVTEACRRIPQRDENGNLTGKNVYSITSHTKTPNAHRQIPLTDRAWQIIELLREHHCEKGYHSEYICYDGNPDISMSVSLDRTLELMCKQCGVQYFNSHLIRKSFATNLHEVDISIKQISLYLGHADMITTERNYIIIPDTDLERKRQAMSKIV